MNIIQKFFKGVNPDEDEPFDDDFNEDEIYQNGDGNFGGARDISDFMAGDGHSPYANSAQGQQLPPQQASAYQQAPAPPAPSGSNASSIALTMGGSMQSYSEVKLVNPEDYNDPRKVADHVMSKKTVILNLEETNKETARRLLDFLDGVAYAIQSQIKMVSPKIYVIAPQNTVISGSGEKAREEGRRDSEGGSIY
ncbi:MAG: cell division protein SepF [Oscillospiraceae bacterium]|nr:cell division protein SepF [Oscillospiraceae bacterium]